MKTRAAKTSSAKTRAVKKNALGSALILCVCLVDPAIILSQADVLSQTVAAHEVVQEQPEQPEKIAGCDAKLAEIGVIAARNPADVASFAALVAECPRAAEAHYALGSALKRNGKLAEARQEFASALQLRDVVSYRIALGVVTFKLGGIDEAAQLFAKASEIDPRSVSALQGRAWVAAQQGDIQKAMSLLERGLTLDPNNAALLFNRAALRERTGEPSAAALDYERVTVLDPAQTTAWCRLGMLRYVLGNSDAAIAPLTQCVDRGAKDLGSNGVATASGSDTTASGSDTTASGSDTTASGNDTTATATNVVDGGVFLARALAETGELERAELTLRRMIESSPANADLKVVLAETYTKMQRFDEALSHAQAATLLATADARGWVALAQAAIGVGDVAQAGEALAKARKLVKSSPADAASDLHSPGYAPSGHARNASLLNNMGVLELRLGRSAQARELFEEALKIDQQFAPAKNNLKNIE